MSDGMSEESRDRASKIFFKKATEAMAKENWDYAIEMLRSAAKVNPANLAFRQTLRGVEAKKYNNNKTGAKMAFLKLSGIKSRISKGKKAKDWDEVDLAAEEGLTLNPWDGQFNADVGEAARNRGNEEVMVFAYEKAVEYEPENKEFLLGLAEAYEMRGNYPGAVNCYQRLFKLDPLNGSYRSKITQLGASETMDRGGYEKAQNTRTVTKGYEDPTATKTVAADGPGMSEEADYQRQIRKEPNNIAHYIRLADYYRKEGDLAQQAETLRKATEITDDVTVKEQWEDVDLEIARRAATAAKEKASSTGQEAAVQKSAALQTELLAKEIDIFARRVERYPADTRMKFELAERYQRQKQFALAIPLYQQAAKDPRIESTVLMSLGKCFLQERKNDLARRQYEKAVEKMNVNDHPKQLCESYYILGRLAEESKDFNKAEHYYNEVLGIDYSYKDTTKRLEAIQSKNP